MAPPAIYALETERLRLRQWTDADYAPFAAMSFDVRVSEFLPLFPDRAACDAFVDHLQQDLAARGWGFWALERKEDAAFLGMAGLHEPGPEFGAPPCVEIGWRLAPEFWGQGYATEAAREILRFGFDVLGLEEISSFTALGNDKSLAVMERLGLRRSPVIFDLLLFPPGHPHRPHCLYAITREQWLGLAR